MPKYSDRHIFENFHTQDLPNIHAAIPSLLAWVSASRRGKVCVVTQSKTVSAELGAALQREYTQTIKDSESVASDFMRRFTLRSMDEMKGYECDRLIILQTNDGEAAQGLYRYAAIQRCSGDIYLLNIEARPTAGWNCG
jgi:hypothetical protein